MGAPTFKFDDRGGPTVKLSFQKMYQTLRYLFNESALNHIHVERIFVYSLVVKFNLLCCDNPDDIKTEYLIFITFKKNSNSTLANFVSVSCQKVLCVSKLSK